MKKNRKKNIQEIKSFIYYKLSEIEDEDDHSNTHLEDGRVTRYYYYRLQIMEKGCLICSALGLFLSVIQV